MLCSAILCNVTMSMYFVIFKYSFQNVSYVGKSMHSAAMSISYGGSVYLIILFRL